MFLKELHFEMHQHTSDLIIRNARPDEFTEIGELLVTVYSNLPGFPTPEQQPRYYEVLKNVGKLTENEKINLIVAEKEKKIAGVVVFIGDMQFYGSGGKATQEKNSSGFRLLGVDPEARGSGIGKALTLECIRRARENNSQQLIIHTTKAMERAWRMYETIGFKRSDDLDFMQGDLAVYGFRMIFNAL